MVAKKKTTVKSKAATSAAKKPVVKKSVAKRVTASKKSKVVSEQSFKLSREPVPFMTYKITKQTMYWLVLLLVILILEVWILQMQFKALDATNIVIL
jgi:hypothetical protein